MQLRDCVFCVLHRLNRPQSSSELLLSCSHAYESFLWQKWAFSLRGHVLPNPLFDRRLIFFREMGEEKAGYCHSLLASSGFCGSYRGLCVWGESWKCEEVIESMLKNAASLLEVLRNVSLFILPCNSVTVLTLSVAVLLHMYSAGVWLVCVCLCVSDTS